MKTQTEIQFSQAVIISQAVTEARMARQAEMIEEFLTSKCDMFSGADFEHYAEETGKPIEWIRANAQYYDDLGAYGSSLKNALEFGDYELMDQLLLN